MNKDKLDLELELEVDGHQIQRAEQSQIMNKDRVHCGHGQQCLEIQELQQEGTVRNRHRESSRYKKTRTHSN